MYLCRGCHQLGHSCRSTSLDEDRSSDAEVVSDHDKSVFSGLVWPKNWLKCVWERRVKGGLKTVSRDKSFKDFFAKGSKEIS